MNDKAMRLYQEKLKQIVIGSRPWSFPMTVISVMVGTLSAVATEAFWPVRFVLTVVSMVFFHAAANLINDYYDHRNGLDVPGSPTTRYREQPIVEGWFTPDQILMAGLFLYLVVLGIGTYLAVVVGPVVIAFGLLGIAASYLYTGDPLSYKYLGMGEVSVFLMWGPLMVSGSYYVQTGRLDGVPVLLSLPLGLLVAVVLLADNLRDRKYDRDRGIVTLATALGIRRGLALFLGLIFGAYGLLLYLIISGVMGYWGALVFVSLPVAFGLVRDFYGRIPEDADVQAARLDLAFGGLMSVSMVLGVLT
ncbi:MAG: 1,4-dihydroxy-2-naphthoate octaprenyltransferase [Candidatus Bipolaricaulota bacterium]